jgi:hypothetical protein
VFVTAFRLTLSPAGLYSPFRWSFGGGEMSIVLEDLTKRYGGHPVVNSVSLEVADGELFVLLGRPRTRPIRGIC